MIARENMRCMINDHAIYWQHRHKVLIKLGWSELILLSKLSVLKYWQLMIYDHKKHLQGFRWQPNLLPSEDKVITWLDEIRQLSNGSLQPKKQYKSTKKQPRLLYLSFPFFPSMTLYNWIIPLLKANRPGPTNNFSIRRFEIRF